MSRFYENGWGSCLDPLGQTYNDYLAQGEQVIINSFSDVDPNDPNDDNWEYNEGSNDYTKINGTEKNALDAGRYPDTEDLDRTGFLTNQRLLHKIVFAFRFNLSCRRNKKTGAH